MSTYRFLLSGCGDAGLCVAEVAAKDGRGEIAALFDPRAEAVEQTQELYPNAVAGDDYVKLIQDTKPDVVVIAGPDHLHAEQALTALEHGAHVLIEKPLTTTVADARRVIAAAEQTDLHVMVDHTLRYVWPHKEIALAAREGRAGQIFYVQGDYAGDLWPWYSDQGDRYTPWRIDPKHPQDILLGGGCHPIDLMLWVVGSEVDEVHCYSNKFCVPEFPADDCLILIFRFENGVLGECFISCGCKSGGSASPLEVFGTEGTLSVGKLLRGPGRDVDLEDTSTGTLIGGHGWGGSVVDFLDTLDGKIENPIPAQFAAKTVALCEAALRSVESHKPEKVERI